MFCNDSAVAAYRSSKKHVFVLAIVWILGFMIGSCFGWNYRNVFVRIVYQDVVNTSNFFARFFAISATLLLSFLAIVYQFRFGIYAFSFLEGSAFGSILSGLVVSFPSFGWLLAFLFLAPKMLILVLQFLYWQSCLESTISAASKRLILILAIFFPVLIFERRVINPTILFLLDYF